MDHDHAAMAASTTPMMNHDHHAMGHVSDTNTVAAGHGGHMKDMMMMAMTFHGGFTEQILFDQWNTKTVGAFVGSWFAVFFVAVLYEGIKAVRDNLAKRAFCDTCSPSQNRQRTIIHSVDHPHERSSERDLIPTDRTGSPSAVRARLLSVPHAVQTFLHILQMTISYGLMLVAMTFNTYLFFAVVLGAGFGHFLFGWCRSSVIDYNEHCH